MKKQSGFTLIELMGVVLIVAILAAIAIPSYQQHVRKARRAEAQSLMLDIVNREEQYILDQRQYTEAPTAMSLTHDAFTCNATQCSNNFYVVTIDADNTATPPNYTITATAQNAQVEDGNLTIDSTGAKTGNW